MSYEFGLHLEQCGIVSQLTPPGTPQRNGVSEHGNRTLLDMVQSMMSLIDLPLSFWGYALETASFTLNRAPYKYVDMCNIPNFQFGMLYTRSSLHIIFYCILLIQKFHTTQGPSERVGDFVIFIFEFSQILKRGSLILIILSSNISFIKIKETG